MRNRKTKIINGCLLAACALIPWNATAINHGSVLGRNVISAENIASKLESLESSSISSNNQTETLLVKSLFEITQGKNKQALDTIDKLIATTPNFKLAYLIRGDLLMAQTKQIQGFGDAAADTNADNVTGLKDEARSRIEHYLSEKVATLQPNLLIQPNVNQHHVIVVDTDKARLYLYKNDNGHLSYVADYYVTIGKNGAGKESLGDKRTPVGVYFASSKLKAALPDLYGEAAYTLSYPNEIDQHHNKTGSGIWLHGTPTNTYSRPPRASDGCVVLSKPDLRSLEPILQTGNTPVIIVNNLALSENGSNEINEQKSTLTEAIDSWRKDWLAQDTAQYLSHYSKDFFSQDGNYETWVEYKTRIQASKPEVSITLTNMSMFSYPIASNDGASAKKMVVVEFEQDFKSNNLQNKMRKRQYWALENNSWKIIYEGKI